MIRKFIYFLILILGIIVVYEIYAVSKAYQNLSSKFKPYTSVSMDEIGLSKERQDILIKIQDPTFFEHSGIQWPSLLTTTTITQSLVKKLFFKDFKKGFKKIEQTLIARFVVNPNISKEVQLIAFISTAYLGRKDDKQIFGFQEGAKYWFNKSLFQLSDDEYLSLIAMLPAPNIFNPNTLKSQERVNRIKKVLKGECI